MPNRIIRDGILASETVCSLSWAEEILYRRLMSIVDDYGRMEANTKWVRSRCYPLQVDKVSLKNLENWMNTLITNNLITLYAVDGKQYLEIRKFNQWCRGRDSKFPAPPANNGAPSSANGAQLRSLSVSVFGDGDGDGICAGAPKSAERTTKQKPKFAAKPESIEECVSFVTDKLQLPRTDGVWLWDHWMANGFTINGRKMASWKHGASNWKTQRYFPSLKDQKR